MGGGFATLFHIGQTHQYNKACTQFRGSTPIPKRWEVLLFHEATFPLAIFLWITGYSNLILLISHVMLQCSFPTNALTIIYSSWSSKGWGLSIGPTVNTGDNKIKDLKQIHQPATAHLCQSILMSPSIHLGLKLPHETYVPHCGFFGTSFVRTNPVTVFLIIFYFHQVNLPVWAQAIKSLFSLIIGIACFCTGVGRV